MRRIALDRQTGKAPAGYDAAGATYFLSFVKRLAFDDLAGLDAAGADANALASAGDLGFDGL